MLYGLSLFGLLSTCRVIRMPTFSCVASSRMKRLFALWSVLPGQVAMEIINCSILLGTNSVPSKLTAFWHPSKKTNIPRIYCSASNYQENQRLFECGTQILICFFYFCFFFFFSESLEVLTVVNSISPRALYQVSQTPTFYRFSLEMILLCPVKPLRLSAAEQFLLISSQPVLIQATQTPKIFFPSSDVINFDSFFLNSPTFLSSTQDVEKID